YQRFSKQRKSKFAPRGDGPFRVLEKIKDNAYKIELICEMNIPSTFDVTDLSCFYAVAPVIKHLVGDEMSKT
ncbi:hypothetical protein CARUB_v10007954mg, partial [Capsella rubella]